MVGLERQRRRRLRRGGGQGADGRGAARPHLWSSRAGHRQPTRAGGHGRVRDAKRARTLRTDPASAGCGGRCRCLLGAGLLFACHPVVVAPTSGNRVAPWFVVPDPVTRPPGRQHAATACSVEPAETVGAAVVGVNRPLTCAVRAKTQVSEGYPSRRVHAAFSPCGGVSCLRHAERASGLGASAVGGTTTTPVAVVATIGSSSISAADADRSGRPRPTTTTREVQGARAACRPGPPRR